MWKPDHVTSLFSSSFTCVCALLILDLEQEGQSPAISDKGIGKYHLLHVDRRSQTESEVKVKWTDQARKAIFFQEGGCKGLASQ